MKIKIIMATLLFLFFTPTWAATYTCYSSPEVPGVVYMMENLRGATKISFPTSTANVDAINFIKLKSWSDVKSTYTVEELESASITSDGTEDIDEMIVLVQLKGSTVLKLPRFFNTNGADYQDLAHDKIALKSSKKRRYVIKGTNEDSFTINSRGVKTVIASACGHD